MRRRMKLRTQLAWGWIIGYGSTHLGLTFGAWALFVVGASFAVVLLYQSLPEAK